MNFSMQRVCAWSCIGFAAIFTVGFWLFSGFLPPIRPSDNAQQIAAIYNADGDMIRVGLILSLTGCVSFPLFGGVLAAQTRRIKSASPAFAYIQIAGAAGATVVIMLALVFMLAAGFRSDALDPDVVQGLNDVAWIMFIITFPPFLAWCIALAMAIFSDTSENPVFPRWAGYFNIWIPGLFLPPVLLVFFKSGPFAWNGLVTFWVALTDFFVWMIVMFILVLKAINAEEAEAKAAASS